MLQQSPHVLDSGGCGFGRALDDGFVLARGSGIGYLGLLFNNCLFLFGFCRTLELCDKDIMPAGDCQKKLMLEDLKFAVVAFAIPFFKDGL